MPIQKKSTSAVLLLAVTLATAAPAYAAEPEKAQVLSVTGAVADAWNKGNVPAGLHFEPSLTIVDDTPPYIFHGLHALTDWIATYRNTLPKGSENARTTLRFLQPKSVEVTSNRAYVAIPGDWTVELHGKREVSHGMITVTLDRPDQDWRIGAWIWTPR